MSLWSRLKSGLSRSSEALGNSLSGLMGGKKLSAETLGELEDALIMADLGVATAATITENLRARRDLAELDDAALRAALAQEISALLQPVEKSFALPDGLPDGSPSVILLAGVNGAGKTTTIGKIANRLQRQGKSVMLAAGDTFRAAAVEQLQIWGERNNVPVIAQHTGADSASVIFDAIQAAKSRNIDVIIADTAGRLHNKSNLMEELKKVKRVAGKLDDTAPQEVLLVLDAGTGQNAVSQMSQFNEVVGVTGIALTKLDGTAKGGVIFALADKFSVPIRYIGVGEAQDDLQPFEASEFVDALLSAGITEQ